MAKKLSQAERFILMTVAWCGGKPSVERVAQITGYPTERAARAYRRLIEDGFIMEDPGYSGQWTFNFDLIGTDLTGRRVFGSGVEL